MKRVGTIVALYVALLLIAAALVFINFDEIRPRLPAVEQEVALSLIVLVVIGVLFELIVRREYQHRYETLQKSLNILPSLIAPAITRELLSKRTIRSLHGEMIHGRVANEGIAEDFLRMIDSLIQEDRIALSMTVTLVLDKLPSDADTYILTINEKFDFVSSDFFYVALASDDSSSLKLANYASRLDKIYSPSTRDPPHGVADVKKFLRLRIATPASPLRREHELEPQILSVSERRKLVDDVQLTDNELLGTTIIRYAISSGQRCRLELEYKELDRIDTCFCFWSPDRPSFVETIEFDYSAISDQINGTRELGFFMCPSVDRVDLSTRGRRRFNVKGWVLPGHGSILMWKRAPR